MVLLNADALDDAEHAMDGLRADADALRGPGQPLGHAASARPPRPDARARRAAHRGDPLARGRARPLRGEPGQARARALPDRARRAPPRERRAPRRALDPARRARRRLRLPCPRPVRARPRGAAARRQPEIARHLFLSPKTVEMRTAACASLGNDGGGDVDLGAGTVTGTVDVSG